MRAPIAIALGALLALAPSASFAVAPAGPDHAQEAQIGDQVYQQLSQKGELISRSSAPALYAILDPIAARIKATADPQYDFPFQFSLVHESQPNAFAVPGGHVYVTDSLMKFVQNKEELAGVLCHETSHDIHHDVIHNNAKDQTLGTVIGVVGALTGITNSGFGQVGANLLYSMQSNTFSRQVESAADHKGAQTCAESGINPWGMVWLFQNFEKSGNGGSMEVLSDHPSDDHRIANLESYFRSDPSLFGRFGSDIASATPIDSSATGFHRPRIANGSRGSGTTTAARPTGRYCCSPSSNANAPATAAPSQNRGTTTSSNGADGTTIQNGTVYGPP